jgi:acetyl-CoA carboxylase beta subunit
MVKTQSKKINKFKKEACPYCHQIIYYYDIAEHSEVCLGQHLDK